MSALLKFPKPQSEAKGEKMQGSNTADSFDKGFVMSSRLYRNEVEPFLSDAAARVYSRIETKINGFNKTSDFISYSQLQGNKKLIGSRQLSRATVSKAIKELVNFGVITILETSMRLGNKFQINEVSLVEQFINETSLENKLVQKVNCTSLESESLTSLETKHTIDIFYKNIKESIYVQNAHEQAQIEQAIADQKAMVEQQEIDRLEKLKAENEAKAKAKADLQNTIAENFQTFWSAYPKKSGKKTAEEKFNRIDFKKHSFEQILSSLEKQKQSHDWLKNNGQYVPMPQTWIFNERWNDEIAGPAPQPIHSDVNAYWADQLQAQSNAVPAFVTPMVLGEEFN